MKKIFLISFLLLSILIFSCSDDEVILGPNPIVEELWRIPVENQLREGFNGIYEDQYIVWTLDEDNKQLLESYDINSKQRKWTYNFSNSVIPLGSLVHGHIMSVYDDILVVDSNEGVLLVLNLLNLNVISLYTNFDSYDYTATFYEDEIYKSIRGDVNNNPTVIAIDAKNGTERIAFEAEKIPNTVRQQSSPAIFYNEEEQANNLVMLQNIKSNANNTNQFNENSIVSVGEDNAVRWKTIINTNDFSDLQYNPILIGDAVFIAYSNTVCSYNKFTGEQNWKITKEDPLTTQLLNYGDDLYMVYGNQMMKINPITGDLMWSNSGMGTDNYLLHSLGTQNYKDKLIHVALTSASSKKMVVLDKSTGENNPLENDVNIKTRPRLYQAENILISHLSNEIAPDEDNAIIAFRLINE